MPVTESQIREVLARIDLPDGGDLVSRDMLRALTVEGGQVRFVIEAPNADLARRMEPLRKAAEHAVGQLDGVERVSVALTAHGPAPAAKAPPSLKVGGIPSRSRGQ